MREIHNINDSNQNNSDSDRRGLVSKNAIGELQEKYEKLIHWGEYLLGASGWQIKVTDNPEIKTAAADYKNKILYFSESMESIIGAPDSQDGTVSPGRLFAFSHELMHFAQALQDPDAYLGTFETAEKEAKKYAGKYPGMQASIERSFRRFFNVFLDIHDNAMVLNRNTLLQGGDGKEKVREVYRKLFPEDDLSRRPLNEQFINSVIMQIMEPGREIKLSEQVEDKLSKPFKYLGIEYSSLQDFIKEYIFAPTDSFTRVVQRIEKVLLPIYKEFLEQDLRQGTYREPEPEHKSDIGSSGTDESMKEFAEAAKKSKKEATKSSSESAQERMREKAMESLKEKGFSGEDASRILDIRMRTNDVWKDMMDLWERFFVNSKIPVRQFGGRYMSGRLTPRGVMRSLSGILASPQDARPFERKRVIDEEEEWKPKKVSLIFLIDQSGSMGKEQREAMQEAVYAIYQSFLQFQRDKILADGVAHATGFARIIGYGDKPVDLFPLSGKEKQKREIDPGSPGLTDRLMRALLGMKKNLGSTNSAAALKIALKEAMLSKESLADGEEIMIVIELTDGDPNSEVDSRDTVAKLNRLSGVFARGIRFGGSSSSFRSIYGEHGEPINDISKLKPMLMRMLREAFTKGV